MLILLLACMSSGSDSPADSEAEDSEETSETDTADMGPDYQEFSVICQGESSYLEPIDLGIVPPAPVSVSVWAHYPDWYLKWQNKGNADDFQTWMEVTVGADATGVMQIRCDGSPYSDVGGPEGFSFVPDKYVVYVAPL